MTRVYNITESHAARRASGHSRGPGLITPGPAWRYQNGDSYPYSYPPTMARAEKKRRHVMHWTDLRINSGRVVALSSPQEAIPTGVLSRLLTPSKEPPGTRVDGFLHSTQETPCCTLARITSRGLRGLFPEARAEVSQTVARPVSCTYESCIHPNPLIRILYIKAKHVCEDDV